MTTRPGDDHKAEALALAALSLRRRYSLPQLVRQSGRKPRPFRRIEPTNALAGGIAAPHLAIASAWAAQTDAILAGYTSAATIGHAVDVAAMRIGHTVTVAKAQFPAAVQQLERWHRGQWLSRVSASTGLDVSMLTSAQDVSDVVDDTVAWNRQLADDVHQQTKGQIASGLMVALAMGAPLVDARARVADAVAKAKRRAAGIGDDQATKASRGMDRARMVAAGVDTWRWRHLDPQRYPRPEHQARNGRTYNDDNAPSDLPGVLPFCKCWTEPVLG